jgi:hypothetical protein
MWFDLSCLRHQTGAAATPKAACTYIAISFASRKYLLDNQSQVRYDRDLQLRGHPMRALPLSSILAFAFGIIFIVTILLLVIIFPTPTAAQYETFRIVIALAAGGLAAVIPGLLNVNLTVGLTANQKLAVKAGGAMAVFVIVYFYSPAQILTRSTHSSVTQTIKGSGSCDTNVANVPGTVNINCNR